MANIKVVFDGLFIAAPGLYREVLNLESPTLESVIQAMSEKHGTRFKEMLFDRTTGKVATGITILVNGAALPAIHSPLHEADEVAFLFPIAGGARSDLSDSISDSLPKGGAHGQ